VPDVSCIGCRAYAEILRIVTEKEPGTPVKNTMEHPFEKKIRDIPFEKT